jgi:hypothetical protein
MNRLSGTNIFWINMEQMKIAVRKKGTFKTYSVLSGCPVILIIAHPPVPPFYWQEYHPSCVQKPYHNRHYHN